MTFQAAVVGGSGYMGAEVLRLLAGHPEIHVDAVAAGANVGATVAELHPALGAAYGDLRYVPSGEVDGADHDVVFLALPHGESQHLVADLVEHTHVVDLGADFRLPAPLHRRWYGEDHTAPSLLEDFAFGLPELFRDEIVAARHVAAPGCYPTAAALALAPALTSGAAAPMGIVVDALSGVSGRGRGLSTASLYAEANESALAYGLLEHRHTGEMEHALGMASGAPVQILFTPHLVPMSRGILVTAYAELAEATTTEALLDRYRDFYAGEAFVRVVDDPPSTRATLGANVALVTARVDERTGRVVALAALDNLTKGGSGQAVQAANLLLGLPEPLGLPIVGMAP